MRRWYCRWVQDGRVHEGEFDRPPAHVWPPRDCYRPPAGITARLRIDRLSIRARRRLPW